MTQLSNPITIHEALTKDEASHWKNAMNQEYESLIQNSTWKLVDPPPNRTIITLSGCFIVN